MCFFAFLAKLLLALALKPAKAFFERRFERVEVLDPRSRKLDWQRSASLARLDHRGEALGGVGLADLQRLHDFRRDGEAMIAGLEGKHESLDLVDSDAKCNPVDSIGSSTKSRVSHSERRPSARFPGDVDGSARRNIEPLQ